MVVSQVTTNTLSIVSQVTTNTLSISQRIELVDHRQGLSGPGRDHTNKSFFFFI